MGIHHISSAHDFTGNPLVPFPMHIQDAYTSGFCNRLFLPATQTGYYIMGIVFMYLESEDHFGKRGAIDHFHQVTGRQVVGRYHPPTLQAHYLQYVRPGR